MKFSYRRYSTNNAAAPAYSAHAAALFAITAPFSQGPVVSRLQRFRRKRTSEAYAS